jgi:hypothetical protein
MSDNKSNDRSQASMREQNSNNLNTSGREGVKIQSPCQAEGVTKSKNVARHPYDK